MRKAVVIILLMLGAVSLSAQEFIGCRTDSGWAETPMLRKKIILTEEPSYYGSVYLDVASIGYHEVYVVDRSGLGSCLSPDSGGECHGVVVKYQRNR